MQDIAVGQEYRNNLIIIFALQHLSFSVETNLLRKQTMMWIIAKIRLTYNKNKNPLLDFQSDLTVGCCNDWMIINPTYFAIYCHINKIWAHLSRVIIVIGLNNNQDIVHFLNSSSCSWWPFRVYMLLLHSTMMRWPRAIEFYFSFPCVAIILNSRFNNFWWKWNMKHTHTNIYIPFFKTLVCQAEIFLHTRK